MSKTLLRGKTNPNLTNFPIIRVICGPSNNSDSGGSIGFKKAIIIDRFEFCFRAGGVGGGEKGGGEGEKKEEVEVVVLHLVCLKEAKTKKRK